MKTVLFLALILSSNGGTNINVPEIVKELTRRVHAGCVYLLHDNNSGLQKNAALREVSKNVLSSRASVGFLSASLLTTSFYTQQCQQDRALFVIGFTPENSAVLFHKVQLSSAIWLLFLDTDTSLEQFFTDINIPFDCQFLVAQPQDDHVVVLTEVYRVSPTLPLQTYSFGNWTAGGGLTWPSEGLYRRRNNLKGLILKAGTMIENSERRMLQDIHRDTKPGGYFGDVWTVLREDLLFRPRYKSPQDRSFGTDQRNGSWNGMIGMILRGEIHISTAGLVWDSSRALAVDFINPIEEISAHMFIRLPESTDLIWGSLLMPFTPALWATVLCFFATVTVFQLLTDELWRRSVDVVEFEPPSSVFSQYLLNSLSAFCSHGLTVMPSHVYGRIVHLTTYVTAFLILTGYSASLLSHVLTKENKLPFNSFEEFLRDGSYQLGVLSGSAHLSYFKMSNNWILTQIYDKQIAPHESDLPRSMLEGLQRVCVRNNYASMSYDKTLSLAYGQLKCRLQKVPNAFVAVSKSMALQKRSPYMGIFKQRLLQMRQSGLLQILYKRNFPEISVETAQGFNSVSVRQVTPIVAFLATGLVIAVVVLAYDRRFKWTRREVSILNP